MRGIINIIFGVVFIIGGLTGQLTFRGTNSSAAIIVLGVVLIGIGIFRMTRRA